MVTPPDTDPLEKIVELYPNVNAVIYDRACSCMSAGQKMSSLHGIKVRAVDRFHSKGHVANCPCHTTVIPRLRKRMKGINTSIAEQSCAWFRGYAHTFNSVGPAMQRFYLLAYGRRHNSVVSCKDLRHLNQYSTEKKLRKATRSLKKPASGAYQCSPKAMRKQRSSPGTSKQICWSSRKFVGRAEQNSVVLPWCEAGFDRKSRQDDKTTKTTTLILVAVLVRNWTFAQLKVDQFDLEWTQTRSLLPKKEDRDVKEEVLKRLHLASEKGVAALREPLEGLRVVPFGSSVSGCGEATSDVDAALWFNPGPRNTKAVPPKEILKRLAAVCSETPEFGFQVIETRFAAKVPVLVLEFESKITCDVSVFRLLPAYNTKLLRAYAELVPALPSLVIAVKRWVYAFDFVDPKREFKEVDQVTGVSRENGENGAQVEQAEPVPPELPKLFGEFFRYFGEDFRWDTDVVSVRLGFPAERKSRHFHPKLFRLFHVHKGVKSSEETLEFLNIEDPIELQRNLNFALTEETALEIQAAIRQTHQDLTAGVPLVQVLFLSECQVSQVLGPCDSLDGYLAIPDLEKTPCRCFRCQRKFPSYKALLKHQGLHCAYPFRCTCGKGFASQADLQRHQISHGGMLTRLRPRAKGRGRGVTASRQSEVEKAVQNGFPVDRQQSECSEPPQHSTTTTFAQI
eukprot:symbB.v1.2.020845.t1/scaffold1711.1/size185425/8